MTDTTAVPSSAAPAMRVALIVAGAFFMETLDGTVIVTALPQIGHSFAVAATDLTLGVTAYLLTLAAFIPASGWAADRFGSRTVFATAICLFTLASVLCGLSGGFWSFIAARVLQGFAAALMAPVGRLVVLRTAKKSELVRTMATLTWPALIAPVLGPAVGGFITTYASWRWIFFLNLPLGILGASLALAYVPNHRESRPTPFDWPGFALTATSLASIVYGLDLLSRREANPSLAFGLMAAGLVIGVMAVRHALGAKHPLLDLKVLKVGSFVISTLSSGALMRIAVSATPFLLPLMFQLIFGMNALQAGLLVLVYMAGNLMMKTVTTPILQGFGFRNVLVVNGLFNSAAILACGLLTPGAPRGLMWAVLFAAGAFRSMNFTANNTLAFADLPPERRSGATALAGAAQQVCFSLGVATAAVLLNLSLTVRNAPALALIDFRYAFAAMALASLAATVGYWSLDPAVGREVSGHRPKSVAPPSESL
ncbi:MAG TPA: MFS transporter [Caulobacteraceae bacterium]|jgi:EmrB/QacA subfamily drug resistance transporter|nr:MFS transporter [Caulobacteraceae bacterium]